MRSFAGHEVGAENWALLASIVATCKLNDVNPAVYIAETLGAITDGPPHSRIEDLMPWRFRKASSLVNRVAAKRLPSTARMTDCLALGRWLRR
jgi:IS66 C-terminal element